MRRHEGEALGQILSPAARRDRARLPRARTRRPAASPRRSRRASPSRSPMLLDASSRFDPDRLHQEAILIASQGRHPRGTRPARRPCRAGAQADRRRRRDRPPARFPRPGIQSRGQHALLQVERRRTDQYRPGAEKRGRAVPRAGAEPGMSDDGKGGHRQRSPAAGSCWCCPRPRAPARPRCRASCSQHDPRHRQLSVSVTTRARRPSEIDGVHYHFIDAAQLRSDARRRRVAGMGRGARQFLRHAARAGGGGARATAATCCSTSTGRARSSSARRRARDMVSVFVLPPSIAELKRAAASGAPRISREVIARAAGEGRRRDSPLGRVRLRHRQRRSRRRASPRLRGDPRPPSACKRVRAARTSRHSSTSLLARPARRADRP